MNILDIVKDIIMADAQLQFYLQSRVYYYQVTENADVSKPFVVLKPILNQPSDFASDKYLSESYLIQVDVESTNHQITNDITKRIRYLLFNNNLVQASSQLDEFFEATKRYVMSRRYSGIPKNQYYKGEHIE